MGEYIVKCILEKYYVNAAIGFNWLGIVKWRDFVHNEPLGHLNTMSFLTGWEIFKGDSRCASSFFIELNMLVSNSNLGWNTNGYY